MFKRTYTFFPKPADNQEIITIDSNGLFRTLLSINILQQKLISKMTPDLSLPLIVMSWTKMYGLLCKLSSTFPSWMNISMSTTKSRPKNCSTKIIILATRWISDIQHQMKWAKNNNNISLITFIYKWSLIWTLLSASFD